MRSAFAFATPAAIVPTPLSATSFTLTAAVGLIFFRSKMSCARSSIEYMSWCGGGEMSVMPGMALRVLAIILFTLNPGSCPPSPGLAPCATFICISSALTRYSAVTPKRPDAICFVFDDRLMPSTSEWYRSLSSPPSPVLLRAPSLFMASARASWASMERAPNDIAPVTKCFTMLATGSTSSIGVGFSAFLKPRKSLRNIGRSLLSTLAAHSLNFLYEPKRVAICRLAIASGVHAWSMPSLR